jgi:serine/threonine-protein kinase
MSIEGSRYRTILKLASGGMATVWIGSVRGAFGFRQLVAIKKPHPHILEQPGLRAELMAEARLASLIQHANVVDVRDVCLEDDGSVSLVMDYIEGASLMDLIVAASRKNTRLPPRVVVRVVLDACAGLHAAHELVDERGRGVELVHRDVSPQNILVGTDGIARVADFGVAKFRRHLDSTDRDMVKGKLAYMAPEYLRGETIDRRLDVFAMGVVIWEALCGDRCFRGSNDGETLARIVSHTPSPVSATSPELRVLDDVVAQALAKSPSDRFSSALAFAKAIESSAAAANLVGTSSEVTRSLEDLVGSDFKHRREIVRANLASEPSLPSLLVPTIQKPEVETGPNRNAPVRAAVPLPFAQLSTEAMPTLHNGALSPGVGSSPVLPPRAPSSPNLSADFVAEREAHRRNAATRRTSVRPGFSRAQVVALASFTIAAMLGAVLALLAVTTRGHDAAATIPTRTPSAKSSTRPESSENAQSPSPPSPDPTESPPTVAQPETSAPAYHAPPTPAVAQKGRAGTDTPRQRATPTAAPTPTAGPTTVNPPKSKKSLPPNPYGN